jgi:hypothetical protein
MGVSSVCNSRSLKSYMWILKNSKQLLEDLKSNDFSKIDSIKTYDFSTILQINTESLQIK